MLCNSKSTVDWFLGNSARKFVNLKKGILKVELKDNKLEIEILKSFII